MRKQAPGPPPPLQRALSNASISSAGGQSGQTRVTSAMRDQARIAELESEVLELRKKLERAESRLSHKDGASGVLSREVEMENELKTAQDRIAQMKIEKNRLDQSVKELHMRLTDLEASTPISASAAAGAAGTGAGGGGGAPAELVSMELALKRGEREKQLEIALQRTKRDKDKAIRIIVQIVGKDKISNFLNQNAGAADILDKLLDFVSKTHSSSSGAGMVPHSTTGLNAAAGRHGVRSKSAGPPSAHDRQKQHQHQQQQQQQNRNERSGRSKSPHKSPAHYRSRIDEYHRFNITGRDY